MRPRGCELHPRRTNPSARMHSSVRADAALFLPLSLPPPLLAPSLCPSRPCRCAADARKKIKFFIIKKERKLLPAGNERIFFSGFNPRAPRASRAKPREEQGFFGLVPLVTHPSSIPLLGGLTPKFLSLSLHSL
jgi:hypothetical protein